MPIKVAASCIASYCYNLPGVAVVDPALKQPVRLPEGIFNNNGQRLVLFFSMLLSERKTHTKQPHTRALLLLIASFAAGIRAGNRIFIGGQLGRDPVLQQVLATIADNRLSFS